MHYNPPEILHYQPIAYRLDSYFINFIERCAIRTAIHYLLVTYLSVFRHRSESRKKSINLHAMPSSNYIYEIRIYHFQISVFFLSVFYFLFFVLYFCFSFLWQSRWNVFSMILVQIPTAKVPPKLQTKIRWPRGWSLIQKDLKGQFHWRWTSREQVVVSWHGLPQHGSLHCHRHQRRKNEVSSSNAYNRFQ